MQEYPWQDIWHLKGSPAQIEHKNELRGSVSDVDKLSCLHKVADGSPILLQKAMATFLLQALWKVEVCRKYIFQNTNLLESIECKHTLFPGEVLAKVQKRVQNWNEGWKEML